MRAPDPRGLTAVEAAWLARILGLLSSDTSGEVAAAAAAATRFLRARQIDWHHVLALPALAWSPPPFDVSHDWPARWRSGIYLCRPAPQAWLTPFERQFTARLSRYRYKPSAPQLDILATMVGNVIAQGGAL